MRTDVRTARAHASPVVGATGRGERAPHDSLVALRRVPSGARPWAQVKTSQTSVDCSPRRVHGPDPCLYDELLVGTRRVPPTNVPADRSAVPGTPSSSAPGAPLETQDEILAAPAANAERYGLHRMGIRPPLAQYIRSTWERRHFVRSLATSKAYAENQNTYLGQFWAVLTPALNALVYVVIFGWLLGARKNIDNTIAFIVVGTFMWRFVSDSVTGGAKSVVGNLNLVRSLHFPRAVLPLSAVLSQLASLVPALVVMMGLTALSGVFPDNVAVPITWRWLLIVPATGLMFVFNSGLAFMVGRWNALVPDLANILPFTLRLMMYISGVIFPVTHYVSGASGLLRLVLEYQPFAVLLNIARQALLNEHTIPLDWTMWVAAAVWAVVAFAAGFVIFWRAEARYGRE